MIRHIRKWLATRHARALNALAQQRHADHREMVKEKARELRASMGLPPLQILNTKGN